MNTLKVNCVLISTILLWASAFVGIKIGLVGYSPGSLALFRFLVASLCMAIVYSSLRGKKVMPWKHKIQLLLGGMAGIGVYNICLNFGELTVSAGIASFVIGLMPVITVLLSLVFLKEELSAGVWAGIIISMAGLALLAMGEGADGNVQVGIALVFLSTLTGAGLTILQKRFIDVYHPIVIMSWVMWGGTLLLLIFTPDLVHEFKIADNQSTAAAVYMGIFPAALAYLAWTYVLKHLTATKASMSLYALPIASTLLGFICLEEIPSTSALMGGTIALAGALIAHRFLEQDSLEDPVAVH
ncbi:MAG: DMT family transporter [Legionellales bacterium]